MAAVTAIPVPSTPVQPPRAGAASSEAGDLLQRAAMLEAQAIEAEAEARELLQHIGTLNAFRDAVEIDECSIRRLALFAEASNARQVALVCRLRADGLRGAA